MNLTVIGIGFLCVLSIYFLSTYRSSSVPKKVSVGVWNQSTGKERSIQSKNGDASMYTELRRRQTVQTSAKIHIPKETRTSSGSTTGAIERYCITGICPILENLYIIFDGGSDNSESCRILRDDGTGIVYDAGNENTNFCAPIPVVFDGGEDTSENCKVLQDDGTGIVYDAGNERTIGCL